MKIREILDGTCENKKVSVRGWVYRKREGKEMIFLVVRDSTGFIQCTVKKGSAAWSEAERVTIESSLELEGTAKPDKRAPGGYEIAADTVSIIGLAEVFPISKDKSEDFLRDVRHLWLRSRRMNLVMKLRGNVLAYAREYFAKEGFTEVSPPMFISAACESGSTLFGLKYFDQNLYLTQSSQLYLEILIYSLENVYCIAPSFLAEKSPTIRDFSKLASVTVPFPRMTYNEAIERLKAKGSNLKWGDDLGYEDEKLLADEIGKPFFIYDYPTAIKAFYCKTYNDRPEVAMSTDMLVPRIGEISTGGAREDDKETLIKRIKEMGLKPEDYDWYLDLRRYGTVPHVGFGMGVERLLTWMLDLENVIDSIPFPRTTRRFYP